MDLFQFQKKIARQIIFFNSLLIVITVIYFFLQGFDDEEFTSILTLLTAISAIYFGSLFEFIGTLFGQGSVKESKDLPDSEFFPFSKIILWAVPIHFLLVFGILSMKAFSVITFKNMNVFLTFTEASFGIYMSNIVTKVFKQKVSNTNEKTN